MKETKNKKRRNPNKIGKRKHKLEKELQKDWEDKYKDISKHNIKEEDKTYD